MLSYLIVQLQYNVIEIAMELYNYFIYFLSFPARIIIIFLPMYDYDTLAVTGNNIKAIERLPEWAIDMTG